MRAMSITPAANVRLSVSLVVYNSELTLVATTLACLREAVAHAGSQGLLASAEVLVVDNASTGDYARRLRPLLNQGGVGAVPWREQLVEAGDNAGFGAGHNLALRHCGASDYHLILNPDVELAEDALTRACRYLAANRDVVLVAPRVYGRSGEVEYLCKRYPSVTVLVVRALGFGWLRRLFAASLARYELREQASATQPLPVPLASGCCLLVRRADLDAVQGFSERYFLYFEDFDLCLRLAPRGGLLMLPDMHIVHHGGYAARKGWRHIRLFARNGLRFFARHGWRWL